MRSSGVDVAKIREAVKGAGIDPRYWVSYGSVASVGDNGDINFTDSSAIHIAPDGVYCDVVLHPSQLAVTCRYTGMAGGPGIQVISPIKVGDEVLVVFPSGSPSGPPVIVQVMHSNYTQVPLGDNRFPIFQNDRILVYSQDVPVDLRNGSGTRLEVGDQGVSTLTGDKVVLASGDTRLGSDGASHPVMQGDNFRTAFNIFLEIEKTYAQAIQGIADPSGFATAALVAGITAMKEALYLSTGVKTD